MMWAFRFCASCLPCDRASRPAHLDALAWIEGGPMNLVTILILLALPFLVVPVVLFGDRGFGRTEGQS